MIRFAILILICTLLLNTTSGCKKAVDNIQKNAAYEIITQGQWKVTKFEKSSVSIQAEYEGYLFQFYRNGVVTAFNSGLTNADGTWSAGAETLSITADFPGQADPLKRLNGTWIITKITATSVEGINGGGAEPLAITLKKI